MIWIWSLLVKSEHLWAKSFDLSFNHEDKWSFPGKMPGTQQRKQDVYVTWWVKTNLLTEDANVSGMRFDNVFSTIMSSFICTFKLFIVSFRFSSLNIAADLLLPSSCSFWPQVLWCFPELTENKKKIPLLCFRRKCVWNSCCPFISIWWSSIHDWRGSLNSVSTSSPAQHLSGFLSFLQGPEAAASSGSQTVLCSEDASKTSYKCTKIQRFQLACNKVQHLSPIKDS